MGLLRTKIKWTIPGAGTAYSVMHFTTNSASTPTQADADDTVAALGPFLDSFKANLPNVVKMDIMPDVEEINEDTNKLIGVWSVAPGAQRVGGAASTSGWASAAGAVISWTTPGIRNSRRIRGRTFIVPLSNECWDIDGTMKSVELTRINTAATGLRSRSSVTQFAIYARPTAPGATDGIAYPALAHRVPDFPAILRSRRS